MSLKEYIRKRDFKKTAEPRGNLSPKRQVHRFVIQKHAASRLHDGLRLEMEETLKSRVVPKGIPFAKGERRLAVEVEDLPFRILILRARFPKVSMARASMDPGPKTAPAGLPRAARR